MHIFVGKTAGHFDSRLTLHKLHRAALTVYLDVIVGGGHLGLPNTAIPQKISINTVIPQKKSANIAIPHRKSMKYRNRKNVVYYSHYALQLTRIAWFRI